MNNVVLMGRLTRDPEVKYTQGENPRCVARYTLAVNRRFKRDGEPEADFINCVVFGKSAEFTEKYFRKGMQVTINGRIQTGSYTNIIIRLLNFLIGKILSRISAVEVLYTKNTMELFI